MRLTFRWAATLLLPVLLLTGTLFAAQSKDKSKDKDKDSEKNTPKTVKAGAVVGKVMAVYQDKKKIRLQVTYTVQTLNAGGLQGVMNAQRDLANARDLQGRLNAQNALLNAQRNLYKTENKTKDVEVEATDEVVVRMARPKEDFDDKGKPRKYTKKELAELRGPDKKLPGYKAEFGDISTDQVIQVTLIRKKGKLPTVKPRRGKPKDEDMAAEADMLADFMPRASMIVILREPAAAPR